MNSVDEQQQQQRQQQQQQQIWSLNNAILFNENVRKCGYMKKLKTNKRRYFVLSLNSLSTLSKATLSVYENEKKYREKGQPKRIILLVDCFAIARIPDQKRFVLGIYTRTDLLATVCDDEKHMNDWLKAIRSILYRTPEYQSRSLKDFHFIWQGCVNRVEGALPKSLLGTYRFCLMPTILYFIRVESTNSNTNTQTSNNGQMNRYEFPLSIIHRCGHKDKTFYLNIGRLSELGAGECWVQTDDQTIAEHMHAQISSFWVKNKKSKSNEDGKSSNTNNNSIATTPEEYVPSSSSSSSLFRPRSSSTSNAIDANQFMMHQLLPAAAAAALQYHHPPPPHYIHYLPYQQQSHTLVNNRNSMPIAATSSTSSQSPAHSRERLHSCSSSTGGGGGGGGAGSVRSHTASDCSNEDLSSQGHYVTANSGHNMTTAAPISTMFPPPWNIHHLCHHHQPHSHHSSIDHSHSSQHFSSSQSSFYLNNLFAQSSSSFTGATVNNPVTSSTSSLSTEMDNQDQHHFNNMFSPINILDVQPSASNNQDNNADIGYAADYDLYPSHIPLASSSSSQACPKCLQMYYMHFLQQQQQQQQHHQHHQTSHQSPITSPKCHCSTCLMNICHESTSSLSSSLSSSNVNFIPSNNNSNNTNNNSVQTTGQSHHYLPTIPAGEPSDYVPMKPINAHDSNDNTNVLDEETNDDDRISKVKTIDNDDNNKNDDDDDENCYLHMSPLAVSNAMIQSASNSVSDSIEFKLKKKDSIAEDDQNDDDKITKMRTTINTSESNDDTIFNGLTRAYSTGSKPQPLAPSIGTQCSNNQPDVTIQTNMGTENAANRQQSITASIASQHIRTRASSTGSHGMKFRAFLSSKRRNKMSNIVVSNQQQQQKMPTCQYNDNQYGCHWPITTDTASSSCCSLLEENQHANKSNKAASAPILSSLIQPRVRSLTLGSKPVGLRLHNLFKNKSTNIATNSINPMLQCPASTQLQPDILGNIYSNSMLLSCGCAHHHFHNPYAHHIGHSHAQMPLCSSTSAMTTSQTMPSQLNANHPLPVSFLPEEGDLMEIDYSANNKGKDHRSSQKIHSHHGHGHGHGHHHSHHHHPHHVKQSNESDSAEKDKQTNEQAETQSIASNNNNNDDDSVDNHNTLAHKLQNSLVINDEGDDDEDEDDAYMMFKPGSNDNDDRKHSKSLSNSTSTTAPLAMNEILSDEDDQQQHRHQNDDEESLYVLLSPNHQCNSPSSNHDNKTIDNKDNSKKKSSAKKLKSFAIRSLYSSITSSSGGSNNGDGGLKFSIKRSISNISSNDSNKNFRINRRNTKSESSNYDQHQKSSSKSSPSPTPANILSSTTTTATSRTTPTPPPTITT